MDTLTLFRTCAVTVMLIAYAFEQRLAWWIFVFAFACMAFTSEQQGVQAPSRVIQGFDVYRP